eukprot:171008-Karenia_brevis.AAC.1
MRDIRAEGSEVKSEVRNFNHSLNGLQQKQDEGFEKIQQLMMSMASSQQRSRSHTPRSRSSDHAPGTGAGSRGFVAGSNGADKVADGEGASAGA